MKKMNKRLAAALCALMLCCTALAACGDSDSSAASETKSDNSAAQADTPADADVTYDVVAIADKLQSDITYKDTLSPLDPSMIEKILKVKPELYTNSKIYIGAGGATAEEIACFEATDETAANDIYSALEARIENQKKSFENYNPEELDKLNDPVLVKKGKYVFMCLSDDNAKAKEIIG